MENEQNYNTEQPIKKPRKKKTILNVIGIVFVLILIIVGSGYYNYKKNSDKTVDLTLEEVKGLIGEDVSETTGQDPSIKNPLTDTNPRRSFLNSSGDEVAYIDHLGNIEGIGNVTAGKSGFFEYIGNVANRITKGFFEDLDVSKNINSTNITAIDIYQSGTKVLTSVAFNDLTGSPSDVITAGNAISWAVDTLNFDGGASPAGDLGGTWANPSVDDDSHSHVYSNIDAFTEAQLYTILSDVEQFYEVNDKVGDADTLDTLDSLDFEPDITAGTTSQYWRGDKSWQTLLGTSSTTAYRGDYGHIAYTHSQDNSQAHSDYMLNTGDTATGNYAFDTDTLFIDAAYNRVGIGTTDTVPMAGLTIYDYLCSNLVVKAGTVMTTVEASEEYDYGWIGMATNHLLHIGTSGQSWMTMSAAGAVAMSQTLSVTGTLDAATINTGAGDMEVNTIAAYLGNQNLRTTDGVTFATVNTGAGGTELYAMNQHVRTTDSPTFVRTTMSQATGTAPFTVASTTKVTNLQADYLDGYHASTSATAANTIPVRNANGYLYLGWLNTLSGETAGNPTHYFVETSDDSFLRQSTPANMVTQLAADGLMPKSGGTFTSHVYAADHGTASTDMLSNVVYTSGYCSGITASTTTIGTICVEY